MTFEREDETPAGTDPEGSPDKDDLPAEPSADDAPMGDTDEHSDDAA